MEALIAYHGVNLMSTHTTTFCDYCNSSREISQGDDEGHAIFHDDPAMSPYSGWVLALHVEDLADDVEDRADSVKSVLLIRRKNTDGQLLPYTKTRKNRTPPLYPWLREDLTAYMLATGIRSGLLFPTPRGTPWRKHDYDNWRERVYVPAARPSSRRSGRPLTPASTACRGRRPGRLRPVPIKEARHDAA